MPTATSPTYPSNESSGGAWSGLTVIGDLVEDIVVWNPHPTQPGTDNASIIRRARGGSGANVAAVAARLCPTRFIGRVGADTTGDALIDDLRSLGVDVRAQRGGQTGTIVVLVDEAAERTMFPDRAAAAELDAITPNWLAGTRVLHVPAYGFETEVSAKAIRAAIGDVRSAGGAVTVDVSATALVRELGVDEFHRLIASLQPDVLFANAAEAALLGLSEVEPSHGAFVIKDGPRPVTVVEAGGHRTQVTPAPVSDVRDTTGAGDAFAAGFLASWMEGESIETACRRGNAVAAEVLTTLGAGGQRDRLIVAESVVDGATANVGPSDEERADAEPRTDER